MLEIFAWGLLFGMIGFGIGRLRLYATANEQIPPVQRYQPLYLSLNDETAINAWAAVYTQSAETLRDTVKMLSGANIAGLAACAAIIASKSGPLSWSIYASAGAFVIGLVAAIVPNAALSDKYCEDSAAILMSMASSECRAIPLPDTRPSGTCRHSQIVSLAAVFFGPLFLIFGLMEMAHG